MNTAPKRRWFAYSLRTLFLLVTLVACWLGYELNWVRQRHQFIAAETSAIEALGVRWGGEGTQIAPLPLRILGESGVFGVTILAQAKSPNALTNYDRKRVSEASRLFPEASISTMHAEQTVEGYNISVSEPKPHG